MVSDPALLWRLPAEVSRFLEAELLQFGAEEVQTGNTTGGNDK